MKFVILIAVSCMFGSQDAADPESSDESIDVLRQKAINLFREFQIKQSDIISDLYPYTYAKHEALNEKLQRIACKWTSDLIAAKTDALNQLAQTKEYAAQSYPDTTVKLCSSTVTLDIDLYINPAIQYTIQSDLLQYQNTLDLILSIANSIMYDNEITNQYKNQVFGKNVTVESLKAYIASVQSFTESYKYEVKSKIDKSLYKLYYLVYQFETRAQEQTQSYQIILYNVNTDFQVCLSTNIDL